MLRRSITGELLLLVAVTRYNRSMGLCQAGRQCSGQWMETLMAVQLD